MEHSLKHVFPAIKALNQPADFRVTSESHVYRFMSFFCLFSLCSVWSSSSRRRRRGTTKTRLTSLAYCEWSKLSHSSRQNPLARDAITGAWEFLGKARGWIFFSFTLPLKIHNSCVMCWRLGRVNHVEGNLAAVFHLTHFSSHSFIKDIATNQWE